MQAPPEPSSRLRLSLAACALVVATSAADVSAQTASTAMAAATAVGQVSETAVLKKIQAYCTRSWLNAGIPRQEWDDCTQDVYLRLLSNLSRTQMLQALDDLESDERRELNRAIWATAQRRRRAQRHTSLIEDGGREVEVDEWPAKMEAVERVRQAIDSSDAKLSPQQREIVSRWSDGEGISRIAEELKLSPARVSDEKYKAIQKLRGHFGSDFEVV
jgi:DNA-binding CsgD family transcriptional regulator